MYRSTRFKVLWTGWMTSGGIATGAIIYAVTRSVGWTIVGVLVFGIVLNAIGQVLIQPITAVRRARRDVDLHR